MEGSYNSVEKNSDARDPIGWSGGMEIQPYISGEREGEVEAAHLTQKPAANRGDGSRDSESDQSSECAARYYFPRFLWFTRLGEFKGFY